MMRMRFGWGRKPLVDSLLDSAFMRERRAAAKVRRRRRRRRSVVVVCVAVAMMTIVIMAVTACEPPLPLCFV